MMDEVYLQCDAPGCDHREIPDKYGPELIDKPCPKCGASLLTEDDYNAFAPIFGVMEAFKRAGLTTTEDNPNGVRLAVGRHGSKTTIEISGGK